MADLPGLIDKAHLNVGMGHNFLKHVERTKTLLFVVDINGFRLRAMDTRITPVATVLMLIKVTLPPPSSLEGYSTTLIGNVLLIST